MSLYQAINPATGREGMRMPAMERATLRKYIADADKAYRQHGLPDKISARASQLRTVADLHRERRNHLADIVVFEVGKPFSQALGEVDLAADIYEYYSESGPEFLADESIEPGWETRRSVINTRGIGSVLGIMPWNFPYYQVARFAAPNVLLGNSLLLKPAPQCPASASAIQEIFNEAQGESSLYRTVFVKNSDVEFLLADPRVRGVSLTGSSRAGSAVAAAAGRHLTKVVLELGGSDPFILLSTEDLSLAVQDAVSARLDNGGQACNAAKRFLIIDHLFDDFLAAFCRELSSIAPADPQLPETRLGPLSSVAAAVRLEEQVQCAVEAGARLILGGHRNGTRFPPTVLTDVDRANPIYGDELFGPVAVIHRVQDEETAVAIANDTSFGLGAYVYTTDSQQADRVADALEVGMVGVNTVRGGGPQFPFGGVKASGFGRELGRLAIYEFANRKVIRS